MVGLKLQLKTLVINLFATAIDNPIVTIIWQGVVEDVVPDLGAETELFRLSAKLYQTWATVHTSLIEEKDSFYTLDNRQHGKLPT